MAVAYKSSGAGVSTETAATNLTASCPATVDAGDILIAHIYHRAVGVPPSTPSGWVQLARADIGGLATHTVLGKIADGSEDGASIEFGTASAGFARGARIHSFSGYTSGLLHQVVRGFETTRDTADPQMPTVQTTVTGGLAVALIAQVDDNAQASATGESGGDWTEAVAEFLVNVTATDFGMGLQTCTPTADPGTVSGGSVATANDPNSVIGFEIRPAPDLDVIDLKAIGTNVSTETNGASLQPTCPAAVDADDILIAHIYYRDTTDSPTTPSGWTLLDGPIDISTLARHWIYGKLADGSEDGTAIDFGSEAATYVRAGRIYSFHGYASGTIEDITLGFANTTSTATATQAIPSVTATATGSKLLAFLAGTDDIGIVECDAGGTNGRYTGGTEFIYQDLGTDRNEALNICTPDTSSSTVTGAAFAHSAGLTGNVIAFELIPGAAPPPPFIPRLVVAA